MIKWQIFIKKIVIFYDEITNGQKSATFVLPFFCREKFDFGVFGMRGCNYAKMVISPAGQRPASRKMERMPIYLTFRHTIGTASNPSIQNRRGAANRLTIRGRRMDRLLNVLFFYRSAATKHQADNCREEKGAEAVGDVGVN